MEEILTIITPVVVLLLYIKGRKSANAHGNQIMRARDERIRLREEKNGL